MSLLDEYKQLQKNSGTQQNSGNERKSLLQEYVDQNGTAGLNEKYVNTSLQNGGGFGATAAGTYSSSLVDENYISAFFSEANKYLGKAKEDYEGMGYSNASTIYGSNSSALRDLKKRYGAISQYLQQNENSIDKDAYSSFSSTLSSYRDAFNEYQNAFKNAKEFYSQWKTEDDYNDYVARQKDYQEKLSYDTVSAQKELDDLNAQFDEAKRLRNERDRYISGAMRDPAKATSAQTRLDSLLKRYGYSDIEEMEKDISGKNQYLTLSKRIQDAEKLRNDALGASDFKEFSEMGASIENPSFEDAENAFVIFGKTYGGADIGNKVTYSRENWEGLAMGEGNGTTMKGRSIYRYMTEEEVSIYNYYLAKDGEEKADEYLDSIAEELNYREATGIYDRVLEGNTATEVVFGAMAGLDQAASGFRSLFSNSDDYVPASSTQIAGQLAREDLADAGPNLPEWAGGASLGQLAYDFTSTSANMTPSFLVSALTGSPLLGSITLGASAAGNAYQEKINLGYSKDQARAYARLIGASEMGLQYLLGGISKLGGKVSNNFVNTLISNVDNAFARTALKLGGNMASEFTEEYLQDVLTPWFENLTLYTENDVKLYTPDYLYSGLMGALTAGFMEGPSTVSGEVQTYRTGKTIQKSGFSAERLAKLGQTFSADSVAYRLAGKVNENTGAYTIGRLFNEIGATLTEQNQSEIIKSLERKGVAHDDAVTISETLAAVVEGASITERQATALEANDVVSKTIMDVIVNPNSTVNQRTQNYNEALMTLAQEKAKGRKGASKAAAEPQELAGSETAPAEGKSTTDTKATPERMLEASVDGKTINNKTGEEVKIESIASIQNGEMMLKLDSGETVNARDVSYGSEGDALIYETVARLDTNAAAANQLVKAYDPAMSAEVYARGIEEAYRYGMYNIPVSEMMDKGSFSVDLTAVQRNTAYRLGQIFGGKAIAREQATVRKNRAVGKSSTTEGKVHFDGDRNALNARQSASLSVMEKIADALGVQIYVFESEEVDGKRQGANGWFDPKDSSIHIDLYAGQNGEATMLFTAAHELTHFIRKWSPAKFKVLANFLMEQYGKKGVSVDTLVQNQIAKAKKNGRDISYDTAYEEVIADSMETMLSDGKVAEKLALLRAKDQTIWGKIKEFFSDLMAKIQEVYKGMTPNSAEGQYVAEMKDALERIQELFAEGLVEASENFRIGSRNMEDFSAAQNTDGESLFQYRAMEADEDTYRGMLKKWGKLTNSQIENLFTTIDKAMEIIKDNLEALDYAWDADINDRAFSPVKPNSDSLYQVSLDFSTLCRKRILQQTVQAQLQEALNQPLTREEGIAIRDALMAIQKEGRQIEVACALCYVESARMKSPAQIKKFINNRDTVLRNYFAAKNGGDIKAKIAKAEADVREQLGVGDTSLKKLPGKMANAIRNAKKAAKASYIPTNAEQKLIDVAKGMTVSDFTSPEGLEKLAKNYPDLFDAYTSFIRNATKSKGIENDTWWRAGDSEKIGDVLIANMNRENGLRSQSWSDFQVVHMLDYIAATIELSTRNAKEQAYSKVPDYVELMGQTGVMINMSLIPARDFTGDLEYDSVEGIDYKRSLELREKYHATAGTICIGMDNAQIKMLLADDTIDYVIPYHRSGMAAHVRKAMHIPTWSEYEKYQNETNLSRTEAQSRAEKYGVKLLPESDPNYQKHTSFSEWFDLKEAQQIAKMENSNPSDKTKQKKYGVMYGGYMAMQNAGTNYLKLCAERGLAPKFSHEKADFTGEDNYWKLLIDRKMVDNVTGEIIEQQTIKPIFDEGEVLRILNDELERYPGVKADQDYAVRRVTEKYLSGELKGGMSAEDIAKVMKKPVDNVAKTNILASAEDNDTKPADYDLESEFADAGIKYSERVTDKDTLSFLNSQKTITTYKTMQVVDGKLYPPMASRIEGKFEDYSEIGVWEQATEHPELIRENGKFKLDKGKGQGSIEAAYNPYMHSSNLVINDQFSGAYKRSNLVTVECVVPASEATSGYHAQYAKDSVGWKPWHTGTVAGSIRKAKGIERQVFLSRWIKPVRIISDAETASMIKDLLDGTDVSIPDNVVWPTLLDELRNVGVKIEESGRVKYSDREYMDAVESGDMETAQMMVDEAAKAAGYTSPKLYHGTPLKMMSASKYKLTDSEYAELDEKYDDKLFPFVVFNTERNWSKLTYTATSKDAAKNFAYPGPGTVFALYGKFDNPLVVNEHTHDSVPYYYAVPTPSVMRDSGVNKDTLSTEEIAHWAKSHGYDGVIVEGIREGAGQFTDDYIVFSSSQLKSADPVTYDDSGNVIPLSERFNADNDDIRYSDRDYSYNALVSKPDMKVTTITKNVPNNRADVIYYAKQNAAKVGKFNPKDGSVSVHVKDIDADVILATNGLKHSLDRRLGVNAPVVMNAGEIIRNSIRVNEMKAQKNEAESSYVLIGSARNENGDLYIVRSVVNHFTNELDSMDVLYAINAKKESAALNAPRLGATPLSETNSFTISIAELLDYVNQYFPEILPDDVLKHYGHAARPDGKLGKSVLYQDRSNDFEKVNRVLEKENAKLKEDVSYLKELLKLQKTVTGGTKFTRRSVEAAAGQLMEYAGARGDKAELAKLLNDLYEHIAKGDDLTWESVRSAAAPAVEWLMDNANDTGSFNLGQKIFSFENDLSEQELVMQVYDSYWNVSTLRTVADVKQKQINALKFHHMNRMQELQESHKENTEKLKREYQEKINRLRKEYRDAVISKQEKMKAKYRESRERSVEGRKKTVIRNKIKDVVNELNTYLLKGTKDKHVMIGLQKAVAEALDVVNMDTVGAEQRLAKLNEELVRAKTPEKIKEIMGKIQRVEAMGDKMSDRLNKLKTAYAEIKDSNDPLIANSHDEVIEAAIESVANSVGDTALRDMSLSQLEDVYDLYKMVLTRIRDANKTFANNKKESIDRLASNTQMEVEDVGGKKKFGLKSFGAVNSFLWNNLKPVYAFKAIGSKTLTGLFDNVRSGEDTWARDVSEARAFYMEQSKKHGYDSWDLEKTYRFRSTSGMDFKLNLDQMMSLYAYSKRSQAEEHLKYGGIVLENSFERKNLFGKFSIKLKTEDATAYNISPETLSEIIGKLTSEQKAFVDQMQDYLSTTMGAKGNEVSLEMYGVKLFKEKFYFPLKSAQQYMAKAREQANGEVKIKNSGFTKETNPHAKNPIVLEGFMDVWANHVNDMSMYHAFTLPLEDFYRVYNYRTPSNNENMPTEGVNPAIENAYGKAATRYIEQLLKDLNGGARSDPAAGFLNKMMGLFKKGAVFASASVVIQQPSAIARALALVDSKYFVGKKMDSKKHAALWEEVKKYAPVAIIKEMGYFDTNMGKSTVDFIKAKEYDSWGDKMTALVKDGGYRDEVLSKAPALADELAWCQIWEAVKRETLDKTSLKPGSEEFLKKAGERFTEVIVNTQVYDSVLSRSANMRSKDTGMKMATAFLAEPTTSINMIADALIQGKRGNRKYARSAIGAVIASQILNAILVSFVYAGRDDDEDETYWEKYIGSLTAEIKDSFNLASYIPFVKDIVSIVQGYDVERSDISVISDLWKAWNQLSSDKLSTYRKVENFAGSIAQLFGLPVRNIMRDARGLYQTVNSFMNGQKTTEAGVKYAIKGALTNQTVSDGQQLYEAMLNDDEAHAARVRSRFKDQKAVDSAIRKALRENDPRIHEAAVARYNGDISEYTRIAKEIIAEGHFSQDYVVSAISTEMNTLDKDDSKSTSSSKVSGMYETSDFTVAIISGDSAMANAARSDIIRTAVSNGKTQKDAESYFSSSAASALKKKYMDGEITEAKAVQALVDYCGKDQESAEERVDEWAFESEHGFAYSDRGDAYMSGEISASELRNILISYGRKSPEEADIQIEVYDWQNEGYEYVTADRVSDYAEHCEGLGIPKDIYLEIRYIQSNTHNDVDANGKTINYSAMKKIMEVINSYDLTPAQKDAVARSIGWSEKNIKKYKLW